MGNVFCTGLTCFDTIDWHISTPHSRDTLQEASHDGRRCKGYGDGCGDHLICRSHTRQSGHLHMHCGSSTTPKQAVSDLPQGACHPFTWS